MSEPAPVPGHRIRSWRCAVSRSTSAASTRSRAWTWTSGTGEIVSVIGPNGAGKSTLFNVITGIYQPDAGDIRYGSVSIVGLRPHQVVKLGIARTFQNVRLFANMTILENAMVGQHCRSRGGVFGSVLRTPGIRAEEERIRERAKEALSFFGKAAVRIPPGAAGLLALLREPPPTGDGSCARDGPAGCCCSTSRRPA